MKKICLFVLLAISVFLFSCNKSSNSSGGINNTSQGKLKKMVTTSPGSSGAGVYNFYYDNSGRLIKAIRSSVGSVDSEITTLSRNSSGYVTRSFYYQTNYSYSVTSDFVTNTNGLYQSFQTSTNNNGSAVSSNGIITNTGNRITKIENYSNGAYKGKNIFTYDNSGNCIGAEGFTETGASQFRYLSTYDSKSSFLELGNEQFFLQGFFPFSVFGPNNMIQGTSYNNGSITETQTISYIYNSNNKPSSASITNVYNGISDVSQTQFYY